MRSGAEIRTLRSNPLVRKSRKDLTFVCVPVSATARTLSATGADVWPHQASSIAIVTLSNNGVLTHVRFDPLTLFESVMCSFRLLCSDKCFIGLG